MQIEHRTSIRKRTSVNVLINYGLTYSKRWKVHDLILSSALVEADEADLRQGLRSKPCWHLKAAGNTICTVCQPTWFASIETEWRVNSKITTVGSIPRR